MNRSAGRERDPLEQLLDPLAQRLALEALVVHERARQHVAESLGRVDRAVRVLEDHLHVAAVVRAGARPRKPDDLPVALRARGRRSCPLVGLLDAGDHPRQGRLAAAALADQRGHLAAAQLEADVADGLGPGDGEAAAALEDLGDVLDREHDLVGQRAA